MIFYGIGPGGERRLPAPARVRLNRSVEAPADALSAVFPFQGDVGNLTALRVLEEDGTVCFEGIVDEQTLAFDTGAQMKLEARSRAALLLDNEAAAETMMNPTLALIFARYFAPHGFDGFLGDGGAFPGELTVAKGMSEWQAAALFCRKFLGVAPRVENGLLNASGSGPEGTLRFGGEIRFSALTVQYDYCRMLSELVAVGADGKSAVLRCGEAQALGVARRRYLTKGANGELLMRNARKKSLAVTVECPGAVKGLPGMRAQVNAAQWSGVDLEVSETEYRLEPEGETTRFLLRRTGTCGSHSG